MNPLESPITTMREIAVGIFDGPHATPKKTAEGPVFLGISSLDNGRIDVSKSEHLSEKDFVKWTRRVTPEAGDLVFSYETRLGQAAMIPDGLRCCLGRRMALVRPDRSLIDPWYLLYYFLSPEFQDYFRSRTIHGSTVDRILLTEFPDFPVRLPPLSVQRDIADRIKAIDDKIELNRRMNETLEAMARAIFKSWFVDFDPVRVKAEGRQPKGIPAHIADLFPDQLLDSPLGPIPKGWEASTLGEMSHKPQYGYTESAVEEQVGPHFIRIKDINKTDWVDWSSVPYCPIAKDKQEKYQVHHGDILIARMADPGHGAYIEGENDAVFASYLIRFRPLKAVYGRFLQYWIRSNTYWDLVRARQAGTTRANLNAKVLAKFPVCVPDMAVARKFADVAGALRDQVVHNVAESNTLAETRDTLLPKLLSGEVPVGGAA